MENLKKFIDYVNRAKKVFPNEKYIINFRMNVKVKIFRRFEKLKIANKVGKVDNGLYNRRYS